MTHFAEPSHFFTKSQSAAPTFDCSTWRRPIIADVTQEQISTTKARSHTKKTQWPKTFVILSFLRGSALSVSMVKLIHHSRLPGLIEVCFGRFWVRGLPFPNERHLGHQFHWKDTLPWHRGRAAKVRILRFKKLPPFRHYPGLQDRV
jgi:hypothetical protein